MSKSISPSDASICNLQAVAEVGSIRARRMTDAHEWNDLDITTIEQLAETSLDELQTVRSVGPVIARKIRGSAQGWMNQYEQLQEDAFEEHRGFDDVDQSTSSGPNRRRVAIFADDRGGTDNTGAFQIIAKQYGEEVVDEVIDDALTHADIDLDDNTTLGWAKNSGDGGRFIQTWYDRRVATGHVLFQHKRFDTPWMKYRRHLEPMSCVPDRFTEREDVETIDDVPPEHRPPKLTPSDVPFPFIEQQRDLRWSNQQEKSSIWSLAPRERQREMVEWADKVVIVVDSGGGDSIRRDCKYTGTPSETVFDLQITPEGVAGINEYDPDRVDNEVPDQPTDPNEQFHEEPTHANGSQRGSQATKAGPHDDHEDVGKRPGRDPASDDNFIDGAFAEIDEDSRLDTNDIAKADPGGSGLGKKKDDFA